MGASLIDGYVAVLGGPAANAPRHRRFCIIRVNDRHLPWFEQRDMPPTSAAKKDAQRHKVYLKFAIVKASCVRRGRRVVYQIQVKSPYNEMLFLEWNDRHEIEKWIAVFESIADRGLVHLSFDHAFLKTSRISCNPQGLSWLEKVILLFEEFRCPLYSVVCRPSAQLLEERIEYFKRFVDSCSIQMNTLSLSIRKADIIVRRSTYIQKDVKVTVDAADDVYCALLGHALKLEEYRMAPYEEYTKLLFEIVGEGDNISSGPMSEWDISKFFSTYCQVVHLPYKATLERLKEQRMKLWRERAIAVIELKELESLNESMGGDLGTSIKN